MKNAKLMLMEVKDDKIRIVLLGGEKFKNNILSQIYARRRIIFVWVKLSTPKEISDKLFKFLNLVTDFS